MGMFIAVPKRYWSPKLEGPNKTTIWYNGSANSLSYDYTAPTSIYGYYDTISNYNATQAIKARQPLPVAVNGNIAGYASTTNYSLYTPTNDNLKFLTDGTGSTFVIAFNSDFSTAGNTLLSVQVYRSSTFFDNLLISFTKADHKVSATFYNADTGVSQLALINDVVCTSGATSIVVVKIDLGGMNLIVNNNTNYEVGGSIAGYGSTATKAIGLGGRGGGGNLGWPEYFLEAMIFQRVLNYAELTTSYNYLRKRWG